MSRAGVNFGEAGHGLFPIALQIQMFFFNQRMNFTLRWVSRSMACSMMAVLGEMILI